MRFAIFATLILATPALAAPGDKPNVVFILADDRDYSERLIVESHLKLT